MTTHLAATATARRTADVGRAQVKSTAYISGTHIAGLGKAKSVNAPLFVEGQLQASKAAAAALQVEAHGLNLLENLALEAMKWLLVTAHTEGDGLLATTSVMLTDDTPLTPFHLWATVVAAVGVKALNVDGKRAGQLQFVQVNKKKKKE